MALPSYPDTRADRTLSGHSKWVALAFVVIAQLMVVLDGTIVNIALPPAQTELGFGDSDRQWIITAYALAFGSLLLLGGRLTDLMGQKRAFIIGLIGFAAASVLGGLAPSFVLLVIARAGQGVFGALLAPAALSLIATMFTDGKDRAKAFGVFGAVSGSGGAIGLLLGGALTEYISWRWCLYVNVIFAIVALLGVAVMLPRSPKHTGPLPRFDILGVVTITLGLVAVVYGFARAESEGWGDALTVGSLVVGVLLVAVFVLVEHRAAHPLLPLRVVLDRDRGGAMLVVAVTSFGLFGLFLFLTYYLQLILSFNAIMTGVAFLPLPLAIIISSNYIAGRLLTRAGAKVLLLIGGLATAAGLLILQALAVDSSYFVVILPSLVIIGIGMGLIFTAGFSTATYGVDPADAGVASAAVNMFQQIGGAVGTALLSSIYGSAVLGYLGGNESTNATTNAAAVHGYHVTFGVSAAALIVAALIGGLMLRRVRERSNDIATEAQADVPVAAH